MSDNLTVQFVPAAPGMLFNLYARWEDGTIWAIFEAPVIAYAADGATLDPVILFATDHNTARHTPEALRGIRSATLSNLLNDLKRSVGYRVTIKWEIVPQGNCNSDWAHRGKTEMDTIIWG